MIRVEFVDHEGRPMRSIRDLDEHPSRVAALAYLTALERAGGRPFEPTDEPDVFRADYGRSGFMDAHLVDLGGAA